MAKTHKNSNKCNRRKQRRFRSLISSSSYSLHTHYHISLFLSFKNIHFPHVISQSTPLTRITFFLHMFSENNDVKRKSPNGLGPYSPSKVGNQICKTSIQLFVINEKIWSFFKIPITRIPNLFNAPKCNRKD